MLRAHGRDVRRAFGSVRVFLLPARLADAFGRHVVLHLLVITNFIRFGQVFKLALLRSVQRLWATEKRLSDSFNDTWKRETQRALTFHLSEHFLENSEKLTGTSGLLRLCSSRHVCTKYAYADVFPLGLFTSPFTMTDPLTENNTVTENQALNTHTFIYIYMKNTSEVFGQWLWLILSITIDFKFLIIE